MGNTAPSAKDAALVWFTALLSFRYWRILANIYFYFQYKLAIATADFKITLEDCTVIVRPVGPTGNNVFAEMVAAIIVNCPARLIFSTTTASTTKQIEDVLEGIVSSVEAGTSVYQKEHGLGPPKVDTEIQVLNAEVTNKRA